MTHVARVAIDCRSLVVKSEALALQDSARGPLRASPYRC